MIEGFNNMDNKYQLILEKLKKLSDNFDSNEHSQIVKDIIDANISKLKEKIEQEDIEDQFREQQFTSEVLAEFFEDEESLSLIQDYDMD